MLLRFVGEVTCSHVRNLPSLLKLGTLLPRKLLGRGVSNSRLERLGLRPSRSLGHSGAMPIPTLNEWGLAALSVLVGLAVAAKADGLKSPKTLDHANQLP